MGRYIFWSMLLVILAPSVLPAQEPIVVNTDLVTIRATVTDAKGNYVLGLEKSAFTIQDNDSPQKITAFSDEDTPVSVAVVFAVSDEQNGPSGKCSMGYLFETQIQSIVESRVSSCLEIGKLVQEGIAIARSIE